MTGHLPCYHHSLEITEGTTSHDMIRNYFRREMPKLTDTHHKGIIL